MGKRNHKHLDFDSSGQCIPHCRPLPQISALAKSDGIISVPFIFHSYLHFSHICSMATHIDKVLLGGFWPPFYDT